ncbi:MAG: cytochrome c biogenesis CcdA family protein [Candidatus Muiribacteriaceae bacterium]
MIESIFLYANDIMTQGFVFAAIGSLIWGVLSVILSPCHLAGIPLMVSFIIKNREDGKKDSAFSIALLFSLGILITILAIGGITLMLGKVLGDTGVFLNYIVAVILIATGCYLTGLYNLNFSFLDQSKLMKTKHNSFIIGLLFGLTLGPCTFAYMAPIIAVSLKYASENIVNAALLYILFAISHTLVIAFAGTFVDFVIRFMNFEKKSHIMEYIKKVCGVLIILAGFSLLI